MGEIVAAYKDVRTGKGHAFDTVGRKNGGEPVKPFGN